MPPNTVSNNTIDHISAAAEGNQSAAIQKTNFLSQIPFGDKPPAQSRSISDHPPANAKFQNFGDNVLLRLQDCIHNNKPLISFSTLRGLRNCHTLMGNELFNSEPDARNPSLLQQCLQKLHSSNSQDGKGKPIALGNGYTLVGFEPGERLEGSVQSIQGKLILQNNQERVEVDVLQLAPPFNGIAIKSDDLLECHRLMKAKTNRSELTDNPAQFSSAMGVGRSASLLVLSRFDEQLRNGISLCTTEPHQMVDQIIQQCRAVRGEEFVHTSEQVKEIKDACAVLAGRYVAAKQAVPDLPPKELPEAPATQPGIYTALQPIERFKADAIVNAANENLTQGGGVCGAIYKAAGDGLDIATKRAHPNGAQPGEAKLVSGTPKPFGTLQSNHVIHAVGPDCRVPAQNKDKVNLLKSAYSNAMLEADKVGCRSIAFPAISTGIYEYPAEEARQVAVETVNDTLKKCTNLKVVTFCFQERNIQQAYQTTVDDVKAAEAPKQTTPADTPTLSSSPPKPSWSYLQARFSRAQQQGLSNFNDKTFKSSTHFKAVMELEKGKKLTDWIWYVFPQLSLPRMKGFSNSFAIQDLNQAKKYLQTKNLKINLEGAAATLLTDANIKKDIHEIMQKPIDALKLQASMTLFSRASEDDKKPDEEKSVFHEVLKVHFKGEEHDGTLKKLGLESRAEF